MTTGALGSEDCGRAAVGGGDVGAGASTGASAAGISGADDGEASGVGRIAGTWRLGAWTFAARVRDEAEGALEIADRDGATSPPDASGVDGAGAEGATEVWSLMEAVGVSLVIGAVAGALSAAGSVPSTVFGRGGRFRTQIRTAAARIRATPPAIQGRREAFLPTVLAAGVAETTDACGRTGDDETAVGAEIAV